MADLKSPALDPMTVEASTGSNYPPAFKPVVEGRFKRRLSPALGLTNFGVNLTTLQPGASSALRHWHTAQDEFVYVLTGELTLVTDAGTQVLRPGMCAGFPKGKADGHHLVNKTTMPAMYLEVGDRAVPDEARYPDVDLQARAGTAPGQFVFTRKDGSGY
jgi:uncharacterized cupin superfamily protein